MPRKTIFKDLGTVDYKKAWDMQTELHNELKEKKLAARKANLNPELKHYLLLIFLPRSFCVIVLSFIEIKNLDSPLQV